ncbi:ABC transporter ATP-binding protein [Actinocorallia sp. A-T 12471]|uniref:ABC transporter ATP-binding protein n=1 Tax=Actinocorallia sp. A-T 12471 TaxID=3089813 RepID=UPI0029D11A19|nr:ABC transporter ATP-binding protein [Actinocorallia sp. A-T 12471]MDX6739045.1 ABC transporter ATP-binding protein [Actinocorallia sp. A-T 12471]
MAVVPAAVSLRGVGRSFPSVGKGEPHPVLDSIDLEIAPGEIVALLGPSGCGKSTLLRLISGLDKPSEGQVLLDGQTVDGVDQRTAIVFQEPRLLPWRDLTGNVALGLPKGRDRAEAERWLDLVGLAGFHGHRPRQVSGGMAQRVALARALARDPGVLLLDEPFAALDALTRLRMQDLLDEVRGESTVVMVTHDVGEALHLADRIVLLRTQPGGAVINSVTEIREPRPRDRGGPALAALSADLLEQLGVPSHHTKEQETAQ